MPLQIPKPFLNSIACCQGFSELAFVNALQEDSPTSIRINPFKKTELQFPLDEKVLWNNNGFYLTERPNFTHDMLFQAGCYYVQEAGSMFIEHALKSSIDFNDSLLTLDLCASPGGKSTLLNSLLNINSVLVSNEVSKQRVDALCQNLTKWGTSNVVVTNNDPTAFADMENIFDIVLVDAPCSGSGLFRKQHDAVDEWSEDNVNLCAARQKRILADIVGSIKNGGILLYSTCSYSEKENEEIVDWLIDEFNFETVLIPIEKNWNIVETNSKINKGKGYRFYPDKTKAEGFFCAVLRKISGENISFTNRKTKHEIFTDIKPKDKVVFNDWIMDLESHCIIPFKDDFLLTNQIAIDFINRYTQLYLKKVGTNIGSVIKNKLNPHHDLALSIHLSQDIEKAHCTNQEALLFYKKNLQAIRTNNGWVLMSFNNFGIGWIKQLGNRFNNYLPNEFRILK